MQVTAIQQQVKKKDRYSIYVDGQYSFSLGEGALLESGLTRGLAIDEPALKRLKKLSEDGKVYDRALQYAAMRVRSRWEMQEYLRRKAADAALSSKILDKLTAIGLLDDVTFAKTWVENRRILKPTSRRKLTLELQQKHVPTEVIDEVLHDDHAVTDEQDVLREVVARKRRRYPDQQKFIAYLARQGYQYEDIKAVLQESGEE